MRVDSDPLSLLHPLVGDPCRIFRFGTGLISRIGTTVIELPAEPQATILTCPFSSWQVFVL
jgi:hypothetical protein